jgi:hypothetical protein
MVEKILVLLGSFICGAFGAYVGSYAKEKGKNLATHEDIDKLLDQVRAVTEATRKIEAQISDEVWDRQKKWELRRDQVLAAAAKVTLLKNTLLHLRSVAQTDEMVKQQGQSPVPSRRLEALTAVNTASDDLEATVNVSAVVCGQQLIDALVAFMTHARQCSIEIMNGKLSELQSISRFYNSACDALKGELGLERSVRINN